MIDFHPDAPDGSVEVLHNYDPSDFDNSDAILCRVTAPLVSLAFGFIKRGVGVRILGREIGQGLTALVKKMKADDVNELESRLDSWMLREANKLRERGHESAAAAVEDKHSCLMVFIEQLPENNRTITEVVRRIEELFTNNNQGLLTLCTVHKAKGLEWPRVFILDRDKYMPSKWAKQEWEHRQEQNLIYVAITRAKLDLRYIRSGGWTKEKTDGILEKWREENDREQEVLDSL